MCRNTLTPRLSSCEYINSFTTFEVAKPKYLPLHIFNIYDDESKYCLLDWVTQKGQALGLAREGRKECYWCVCEGVNVCVWSPERANPHHRSSTHCSVCPETRMQIWHGSVNNLLEFAHYRFASLNFNLSPNRPCWWERACGFKLRGGWLLAFGYMVVSRFMCIRIHCAVCVNVSLHLCIYAVRVHAFQWGDPLGRTVLRAGLWSGSPQMRSCFLWNDLPHNWFRLKDCMTK